MVLEPIYLSAPGHQNTCYVLAFLVDVLTFLVARAGWVHGGGGGGGAAEV